MILQCFERTCQDSAAWVLAAASTAICACRACRLASEVVKLALLWSQKGKEANDAVSALMQMSVVVSPADCDAGNDER